MVITPDPDLEAALTAAAQKQGLDPADLVLGILRQRFLSGPQANGPATRLRTLGLHTGAIVAAPDFDAPLPDDFWAGQP
jgi:hypothetical protein